ncbi:hypothetical protein GO613_01300 [Azoarcus communis]|uniref:phage head-tail joining protein n=1 Tax=Parazoarcus communis TaxID=41977 RepID=UPI0014596F95|nr:hypothetical protein [Parazoarcus communis]NMG46745.1 hypothetical protein [Parazoarcus communis]
MALSQADIDALNEAIALGERMVRFSDGRQVEYRSVPELIQARDDLQRQLARKNPRAKQTYLVHGGRGFR